jgi:Zn-finger nucleic acid-binding protein
MNCLHLDRELGRHADQNISVFRRPECAGLWLPGDAVGALLGPGEKLKLRSLCSVRTSDLVCPDGGDKLGGGRIGKVAVDFCLACNGLWPEPGELGQLRERRKVTPCRKPEKGDVPNPGDDGSTLALALPLFAG